jgi:hypothetical protein
MDAGFCPRCGQKLDSAPGAWPPSPASSDRRRLEFLMVLLVIGIVVLAYMLLKGSGMYPL